MGRYLLIVAVLMLGAPAAGAQSFAVGPNISTLGIGAELAVKLDRSFVVRFGGNYFDTSLDGTISEVTYGIGLNFASIGVSLDFHPIGDGLLFSVGYFWNGNRLNLHADSTEDIKIGSRTFTPAEVGSLSGDLEFDRFAPFVGVGYDNTFHTTGPWSFLFRIGVLFMGSANVDLVADGTLANDSSFQSDLQSEERNVEDILDIFGIYPVVALSFRYRF